MVLNTVLLSSDTEGVKLENSSFTLKLSLISWQEDLPQVVRQAKVLLLEENDTVAIQSSPGDNGSFCRHFVKVKI